MTTYSYKWAIGAEGSAAKATVFAREGNGPDIPVAGIDLDLSLFDTPEKVEAEAAAFASHVRDSRQAAVRRPSAGAVSRLRSAEPRNARVLAEKISAPDVL